MDNEKEASWYLVNHGLYYRPKAMGYTGIRDDAGLFTHAEATETNKASNGEVQMLHKDDPAAVEFMPATYTDVIIRHLTKQRDEAQAALADLKSTALIGDSRKRVVQLLNQLTNEHDMTWASIEEFTDKIMAFFPPEGYALVTIDFLNEAKAAMGVHDARDAG